MKSLEYHSEKKGRVHPCTLLRLVKIDSPVCTHSCNIPTVCTVLSRNKILDSDDDICLFESDCEESEEGADEIDNIPVNPDTYGARDGTE
ncbi:hypothetical protein TNCV_4977541 [Trichonephila clavipes]|nr:hypothetical protein TNCV_4977541 [Trichonephila clavipes]